MGTLYVIEKGRLVVQLIGSPNNSSNFEVRIFLRVYLSDVVVSFQCFYERSEVQVRRFGGGPMDIAG